ncbi:MAG: hypothetical protein LBN34_05115 [Clostridiales Family XIII bacterium]|jgi:hypothetical protein|nr:hypothetical protein [Clostridiales Family XIII bacterium]
MPLIKVSTSLTLEKSQKDSIKSKLGEAISIIPGKSEGVLMIDISDGHTIYFHGEELPKAAHVTVDLYGTADFDVKAEFTEKVFEILKETADLAAGEVFIRIGEYPVWGAGGKLK